MKRTLFFILGIIFLILGILGYMLPILPGTINLILAAGFFAKSSPRLEHWLLNHPHLGPTVVAWRKDGSMSLKAKRIALISMWIGLGFTILTAPWFVGLGGGILGGLSTWYILTRPTRRETDPLIENPVDAC